MRSHTSACNTHALSHKRMHRQGPELNDQRMQSTHFSILPPRACHPTPIHTVACMLVREREREQGEREWVRWGWGREGGRQEEREEEREEERAKRIDTKRTSVCSLLSFAMASAWSRACHTRAGSKACCQQLVKHVSSSELVLACIACASHRWYTCQHTSTYTCQDTACTSHRWYTCQHTSTYTCQDTACASHRWYTCQHTCAI